MPSSQRPFFLSSFLAAFRPQQAASSLSPASSQANKHHTSHSHSHSSQQQAGSSSPSAAAGSRSLSTTTSAAAAAAAAATSASSSSPPPTSSTPPQSTPRSHSHQRGATATLHSPRAHGGIPIPAAGGRRRGSDSSSEGFRDVLGGEKWYIGGRTAGGEERFFKLGVVRRPRSQDRLSLDRLSL
ncbi:hypothetical protein SLS62_007224 [Diatrype stigma]|uniref:Uncharacterized protein n=1 Tax=Diatrype stigma TaxID=117547 RepID=A0AAN9UM48_9PEZI